MDDISPEGWQVGVNYALLEESSKAMMYTAWFLTTGQTAGLQAHLNYDPTIIQKQ